MSSLSAITHALQNAIREGTLRPDFGVSSVERALRQMTPEQIERLRNPGRYLSAVPADVLDRLRTPAVVRFALRTAEEA